MIIATILISYVLLTWRKKSILSYITLIQLASIFAWYSLGQAINISSIFQLFNIAISILILVIISLPWKNYRVINKITTVNTKRVNVFTRYIMIYALISFLIFSITAIIVNTAVVDINAYKYVDGVRGYLLKSLLPFDIKWLGFASLLMPINWFLIPLHYYHLLNGNKRLAMLCIILSLNIVVFGFTIFSRWTITHYILVYYTFAFMFRHELSKLFRSVSYAIIGILVFYFFIDITIKRFDNNKSYINSTIPIDSPIQDPTLYSALHYISQWHGNSKVVLEKFTGDIFYGQSSLTPLLNISNMVSPIKWDYEKHLQKKISVLGSKYYYQFLGLAANWIYDFGYLFSIIIAMLYYKIVVYIKPSEGKVSINHLLLIVLVIQLPLLAIFYSTIGGIVLPLVMWLPLNKYLKSGSTYIRHTDR